MVLYGDCYFFVVDGGYTEWSLWSSCTKSCGGGNQLRTRNCTQPLPLDGGLDCADLGIGGDEESRQCNAMVCPGQIGMDHYGGDISRDFGGGTSYQYMSIFYS